VFRVVLYAYLTIRVLFFSLFFVVQIIPALMAGLIWFDEGADLFGFENVQPVAGVIFFCVIQCVNTVHLVHRTIVLCYRTVLRS
jgi:hypothetical protein